MSHGGTIIWYEITGREAAAERYGAIMEQNGKFVEDEEGPKMKFDDAKNGLYTVTALLGRKRLLSAAVFAHPGETIFLTFDLKQKTVKKASNSGRQRAVPVKPIQKSQSSSSPVPIAPVYMENMLNAEKTRSKLEMADQFTHKAYRWNPIEITMKNIQTLQSLKVIPG